MTLPNHSYGSSSEIDSAVGAAVVPGKASHKTCKAVATVISKAVGGDADKNVRDCVAAAKTADKILAADVAGTAAAGERHADETAGAAGLEPEISGMGNTCMSDRNRSEAEKLCSGVAGVAAKWRCEIGRLGVEPARMGDTCVAEWWSE